MVQITSLSLSKTFILYLFANKEFTCSPKIPYLIKNLFKNNKLFRDFIIFLST